jgi:hypothetical protein
MKYRKPITNIRDRHVLIELDGDFTHYEMRHILNHAYLNHKAPHEYDEAKKYIRDLVIGNHNSVYIMNNGQPEPLASASIFYSPAISVLANNSNVYYDHVEDVSTPCGIGLLPGFSNNGTCTSNTWAGIDFPGPLLTYGYNNGTALMWELLYTGVPFTSLPTVEGGTYSNALAVGPRGTYAIPYAGIKYAYALYQTSNNPLTLSTYYYWEAPSKSLSYVYFNLVTSSSTEWPSCSIYGGGTNGELFVPIFSSQGNYSFNANTYYISMWQFTYT